MYSSWSQYKLKDICTLSQGQVINSKTKHLVVNEGIPLLRITDLLNNTQVIFIDKSVAEKNIAKTNDIIFTRTGQVGLVFKGKSGVVHNNCFKVIPDETLIDSDYLYYFLKTKSTYSLIQLLATGSAQPDLTHGAFLSIKLRIPPIKYQKRIAAILSAFDKRIDYNSKRIAILEQMAEQIYKEWFVRMRFPGHEKTIFVKGIPKDWVVRHFEYFGKEVRRGVKKEKLNPEDYYVGLEHLPVKSLTLKRWDYTESIQSDKLLFEKGEILFCKIRPYLHKVAIAPFDGVCSTDTIVIKPTDELHKFYTSLIAVSNVFIDFADLTSNGTKMPRADWKVLRNFKCFDPGVELLIQFNNIVSDLFEEAQILNKQNVALKKTRDLLLPRLISGKLPVEQASQKLQEVS